MDHLTETKHTRDELDQFWKRLAQTVAQGDFPAYVDHYHQEAVYVSIDSGESQPIARALLGWQPGFILTQEGKRSASVKFRFTQRLLGPGIAHETGVFRYSSAEPNAIPDVLYVHFEALLVKKDRWQLLMEYQKESATQEHWEQLG